MLTDMRYRLSGQAQMGCFKLTESEPSVGQRESSSLQSDAWHPGEWFSSRCKIGIESRRSHVAMWPAELIQGSVNRAENPVLSTKA